MTDTNPIPLHRDIWTYSLSRLLGVPQELMNDTILFTNGALADVNIARTIDIARGYGVDIIFLSHEEATSTPTGICIVPYDNQAPRWISGCTLYAASETAPIEILTGTARWFVNPELFLREARLPNVRERARGRKIAMRRWSAMTEAIRPRYLARSEWAPAASSNDNATDDDRATA